MKVNILKTHRFLCILLLPVLLPALEATCLLYLCGGSTVPWCASVHVVLSLCSVTSCWKLESSIYTPGVGIHYKAGHPAPLESQLLSFASTPLLLLFCFLSTFPGLLTSAWAITLSPFLSIWVYVLLGRQNFTGYEEGVEINLCVLGTSFQRGILPSATSGF